MIRVLQVIEKMDRGGAETFIMNLYRNINRSEIQFDFLVHDPAGHYIDEIKELGGNIYPLPSPSSIGIRKYKKLLKEVLTTNGPFNAIHSHIHHFSGVIVQTARNAKIPVRISHSHTSRDFKVSNPLRKMYKMIMETLIKNNSTLLFYCSDKAGQALYGSNFKKDKRSVFIPNSVQLDQFKSVWQMDKNEIRSQLGIPLSKKIVGHVGSFTTPKNHLFLIEVFHHLVKTHPDFHLVLVGGGPLRSDIESKVNELGMSENVTFFGVTNDVPMVLRTFDIMLFPSLFEGLPTVIVEAQAAGIPAVLSNTITTEVDMDLGLLVYNDLNLTLDHWSNTILELVNKRVPEYQIIVNKILSKGFDTAQVAELCERLYINGHK
ncbi:glycosyltransferase family 1 protein [Neobacillus niacini]|uniref:glycosyltransferase family 1 protein n=1 Tax=Neobacillus niacini TaxID=86668 RepID=UPI003B01F8F7